MTIEEIKNEFAEIKAKHKLLKQQYEQKQQSIDILRIKVESQIKARWIITEVEKQTQQRFKNKVETLITMAIQSVFDRPFQFHLEFEHKRNVTECRPIITEIVNGKERIYDKLEDDLGGGLIDIVSFASRIVLWSLEKPKSRNVIILDEPMKNMGKLITLGGQVLREISHKLNFQLIIITHDDDLIEIGDKSFEITHNGNKSNLKLVKGEEHKRINRG